MTFTIERPLFPVIDDGETILGTLSALTNKYVRDLTSLPDWLEEGTEAILRDNEEDSKVMAAQQAQRLTSASRLASPAVMTPEPSPMGSPIPNVGLKAPTTDLDRFYAEVQQHDSSDESSGDVSEPDDDDPNASDSEDKDSDV
jgi:hypothetical protein